MQDFESELLQTASDELVTAVRLSKQGAYNRRPKETERLFHCGESERLLKTVLNKNPAHPKTLMMMAQVCEGRMEFRTAIEFINRGLKAGEPKSKRILKKIAQLRQNEEYWNSLVISPINLRQLGQHLNAVGVTAENQSLQFTREWLTENLGEDENRIINALEFHGAFTDFQVLANVVYG